MNQKHGQDVVFAHGTQHVAIALVLAAATRRYRFKEIGLDESSSRMTKPDNPPTNSEVAEWLGGEAFQYWEQLARFIDRRYPGVFTPEWLFGGRKHGWSLRYKKSKSFCTFIPEKNRLDLLIVFGLAEREKVESIRDSLSAETRMRYDAAHTYHDGKWLLITVDSDTAADVQLLLAVKRKPKI